MTEFDLAQTDRLLTTTKQVRKRLDLSRPVDLNLVLDCIDIASAAPMGGNLERNRWLIVDDPDRKPRSERSTLRSAVRICGPTRKRSRRDLVRSG